MECFQIAFKKYNGVFRIVLLSCFSFHFNLVTLLNFIVSFVFTIYKLILIIIN